MKNPKCRTCQTRLEKVLCYCQEPQKQYFCWTCRQHYSTKQ